MSSKPWFNSDDERRTFRRLNSILTLFRGHDTEMPVQQMLVFCWVALNDGGVQRDLCAALDMPHSTASRNLSALSPIHRLGKPGLGLVTWSESVEDRRVKLLVLTDKGRAFARQVLDLL
jgi:DNA-binding MarR family transcriptional regulator